MHYITTLSRVYNMKNFVILWLKVEHNKLLDNLNVPCGMFLVLMISCVISLLLCRSQSLGR